MLAAAVVVSASALAIERLAYLGICRHPAAYRAWCRSWLNGDPVEVLVKLFVGFKLLQLAVFASWCCYFALQTGWPRNWDSPVGYFGIALVAAGQILNAAVFWRLGRTGVFYGDRLGYAAQWSAGFPYSVFDHPQYVGAALSIWGLFLLLRYPHPDWLALPLLESAYYAIAAFAEGRPEVSETSPIA